ncbi:MAG: hypothetical protein AAF705_21425 [Bacteroidota bacterium]
MKKITLLLVTILGYTNALSACECSKSQSISFDLLEYHWASHILEVRILKEIPDDYEERLAQYQQDTMGWDKPFPPVPFPLRNTRYVDFEIEIVESFKGVLKSSIIRLRADWGSSCAWELEVGETYIFYFVEPEIEEDISFLEVAACQRKVKIDEDHYASEIKALRLLKNTKEGSFVIDQSELLTTKGQSYKPVKGFLKNGKLHGKISITEPLFYSNRNENPLETILSASFAL